MRELKNSECSEVRRLVRGMCANYDREYGCLPLDSECYMFGVICNGGAMCKYFRNALLPMNTELNRVFTGAAPPETKPCKLCGREFPLNGRKAYCSEKCFGDSRRKSVAKNVQAYRKRKKEYVIN